MAIETTPSIIDVATNNKTNIIISGNNLVQHKNAINTFSDNLKNTVHTDHHNNLVVLLSNSNNNNVSSSVVYHEEDGDSSSIDSDSDYEENVKNETKNNNLKEQLNSGEIVIIDKLQKYFTDENMESKSSNIKSNIGSIAVQNSSDITFGNKTFYQGPVTIKQFLLDNNNSWKENNGNSNPAYMSHSNEDKNVPTNCTTNKMAEEYVAKKTDNTNDEQKLNKVLNIIRKPMSIIAIGVTFGLIIITIIVITTNLFESNDERKGDGDDSRINIPINSTIDHDRIIDNGTVLRFVPRTQWIAQPPNSELNDLDLPSTRVIIAHTVTEHCSTQASCSYHVRFIQTFHIESQGWDDIGYNFLVGGDGAAYEGRGWNKEGAHTKGFNKRSICIAFIGTFNKVNPPQKQLRAAELLIEEGLRLKKLSTDYRLYGHRQLIASESPGENLYEIIKKWPHWSDEPF